MQPGVHGDGKSYVYVDTHYGGNSAKLEYSVHQMLINVCPGSMHKYIYLACGQYQFKIK